MRNAGKELMHRLDHLIRVWEGDGLWRFLDDDVLLDMLCELEEWRMQGDEDASSWESSIDSKGDFVNSWVDVRLEKQTRKY